LIDEKFANNYFSLIDNILQGKIAFEKGVEPQATRPFAISSDNQYSIYDEAPVGSVAVISLDGVMTRESQFCGPAGTAIIAQRISEAAKHKNISSIIFKINSGGGAVSAVNPLWEAIDSGKKLKPIIAFVDDMAASAALISISHCNEIICSSEITEVGSLGVMAMFKDNQLQMEAQGIKFHKVYADQSSLKNLTVENALKGDYALLKENELNPLADYFIKDFKKQRPNVTDENVYKAEMYFAKNAKKIGLIDFIGNMDFAINRALQLAKANPSNPINQQKQNSQQNSQRNSNLNLNNSQTNVIAMDKTKIPILLMILGYESLVSQEGHVSILKEDVDKISTFYQKSFGTGLMLKGATIDEEGGATLSEKSLLQLNNLIATKSLDALQKADEIKNKAINDLKVGYEAQIKSLSDLPEDFKSKSTSGNLASDFLSKAVGVNSLEGRPWNEAALAIATGDINRLNYIKANGLSEAQMELFIEDYKKATIDITQLNSELGDYYREVSGQIKDMMVVSEEIDSIFPRVSSGIQDEYSQIYEYITEFLQARNAGDWVTKGSHEFQAETVKLTAWQVTKTYLKEQMYQFMTSWLATKTKGTDPYQDSFIQYFVGRILMQINKVERPYNAIRGVYVTPTTDVAGLSVNSSNGLLKSLQMLIAKNKILPFNVGKGTYNLTDDAGNVNRDHVYYKIHDIFNMMPQKLRDAGKWIAYISKNDLREREKFDKEIIAKDANYADRQKVNAYENLSYVGVPHWVDGLIVITVPGNGAQIYREKNDDNRVYIEKLKRSTYVHMDGADGTMWALTGKQYSTRAALLASKGENQRIFTNAEFGAYTSIDIPANDTTPSVSVHNILKTSANTVATTITTFDDAVVGQKYFIIGGSNTNSSTIATGGNFIGLSATFTFSEGAGIEVLCTAANTFKVLSLFDKNSTSAIELTVDDATPSVAGSYLFITNNKHASAVAITDFTEAQVGKQFKVIGGGGTNATTIAKSGKFAYIDSAWTGTVGQEIVLVKRSDGNFIQVIE